MNWYQKSKTKIYSKQEMINMGADGYFPHAILINIPINKITGKEPVPADYVDENGNTQQFKPGKNITTPIEVEYINGEFILYSGNHRLKQAEINGQNTIKAFVNSDDYSQLSKNAT